MNLGHALRLSKGDVLALTGGGGKTTAMFRLANEAAAQKWRVLTTTSTRIFAAQINRSPAYVAFDPARQTLAELLPQLESALAEHGQVLLIGQADPDSGKAFGVPSDILDALAATGRFDLIINEADGSRMRPFKAPATHEPVIPASTTLVTPLVGLDVLGQPLNDDTVHRAELVSQLSGTALGQPVTAETVVAVLTHPQGGLKAIPARARVVPLLNKAETPTAMTAGRALAAKLLATERFEVVVLGAVQSPEPVAEVHSRIAAVILAAGGSSRFGSPKQLARWGESTFLERVVKVALASSARPVIVVLGAEIEQSRALLAPWPSVEVVINRDWAAGQSTSMQAGLAVLPSNVSAAIFLLVDLPGVTSEVVEALVRRHRQTLAPLVWPEFEGRRGNPVLFDRLLFPKLREIQGDTGGRPLLQAYGDQAERVSVPVPGILLDVDRLEDLTKFSSNGLTSDPIL